LRKYLGYNYLAYNLMTTQEGLWEQISRKICVLCGQNGGLELSHRLILEKGRDFVCKGEKSCQSYLKKQKSMECGYPIGLFGQRLGKVWPEMTAGDIQELIEAFGLAAQRAKKAGFDGVQIHAAHGYLMNQFLSPLFNKRSDAYGGSVENRYQILREVLKKIRSRVGSGFPVLIKLNSQDFVERGLTLEDSLKIGRLLQEDGIDAIELSGGTFQSGQLMPSRVGITNEEKEAYFLEAAKVFKETIKVPLILVGGIRSLPVAQRIIEQGWADYISMSRPFIRESGLIKRWKSGDPRKASCLSDNQCFGPAMAGEGIYCVVEKKEKQKVPERS